MSKTPITNPVLTAILGLVGLTVAFATAWNLFVPGIEISGVTKGKAQPVALSYGALIAGLASFVGCSAIYLRKRWGYRCASVGFFIFVPTMIYSLTTSKGSPLGWLWVTGYFGMAMHFWQTGRPPRMRQRVPPAPPTKPFQG